MNDTDVADRWSNARIAVALAGFSVSIVACGNRVEADPAPPVPTSMPTGAVSAEGPAVVMRAPATTTPRPPAVVISAPAASASAAVSVVTSAAASSAP